ncbi:MAG: hypothetical protein LBH80_00695, partial [Prevotellaceae bacterium]|nr:hypothetical protein [Prevotellaceae bacterium]
MKHFHTIVTTVLFSLLTAAAVLPAKANSIEECERLIRAGVEARNRKEHVKSLELLTDAKLIAET